MKIYTKTGDQGSTGLFGGSRVPKYHPRIEAYGTVDELNSWLGYVRDHNIQELHKEELLKIQHLLFAIGSMLAADPDKKNIWVPEIQEENVVFLENSMDQMEKELPPLKNFILPGGHPVVSSIHIARCVCRRTERLVVALAENEEVSENIIIFLNRLSDYLFMLARITAQVLHAEEIPWIPKSNNTQ